MAASTVRSDYDQLKQISSGFSKANSAVASSNRSVNSAMQQLKGGDWIGKGAKAFYKEMDSDVMPSNSSRSGRANLSARSARPKSSSGL